MLHISLSERLVSRAMQAIEQYSTAVEAETKDRHIAILAVMQYGQALIDGRGQFPKFKDFQKWITDNQLDQGKPWCHPAERSAAVAIAQFAIDDLSNCPSTTPTSIVSWYRKQHPDTKRVYKKRKPQDIPAPAADKAAEVIRDMEKSGQNINGTEVAQRAMVGKTAALKAIAVHRATLEITAEAIEDQQIARLTEKQKLTLQDAIRIHIKRLDKAFDVKVAEEVRRRIAAADDETRRQLTEANRKILDFQRLIGQRGVFTRSEFKQLQMAVHPDNTASLEVRNRLIDLLVKHETRLILAS